MKLKLGLDIGVASVGWGIIDENYNVIDCGVRLFSENSAKGNETRRTMRSSRRRLRRLQHRLQRMDKVLTKALGVKKPVAACNIYEIRCRGLQQQLTKEELFAAIMHLAKRRGTHFLTAEDFEKGEGEAKSTEEILQQQAEKLKDKYVCQIQYQKYKQDGKVRGIENCFRNWEYRKELVALLTKQGEFYPSIKDATDKILGIYDSKRHYSIGPGGPNNPTPYGRYRYDQDGNIMPPINLIDEMRGKCTYFPEEKRMAHNAYTACLFNLLNDLNNMTAAGNPISYQQKQELVDKYINKGKSITLKSIAKVTGVKDEELRGYRINTKGQAIFTEFAGYKAILKALAKAGLDDTFIKGNRKLADDIADILTLEKEVDIRYDKLIEKGIDPEAAEELKKLPGFTKYHSLSQKAMELILDDLWHSNENQMQLFNNHKDDFYNQQKEELGGINIPFDGSNWIVSPITKRSVNEAIKVINQARALVRKKYNCEFAEIVVEMAREKNSDERVKFINDLQKKNSSIRQQIEGLVDLKKLNGKRFELMKLLIEQDFKCAYSGKQVGVGHVLNDVMEVDHIIPKSLSFDDSMANKVAVLSIENQKKGQTTPCRYILREHGQKRYNEFKAWVLNNPNYKKNKKKRENLLYEGDPQQDLEGFINRNLVDTRYACRAVLNLLQSYFQANQLGTRVSVVKGSFTHAFRKKAHLDKDRDATYAHHAQDALIVAGLSNTDLVKKVNKLLVEDGGQLVDKEALQVVDGKLINTATGEVIEEKDFDCTQYIRFIKTVDTVKPKYSHKVDRKPNRALYDQQIKSTRVKEGKTYIVTKYKNIYDQGPGNSGEKLKKKIQTKPEDLLMYLHDPKTFALLQEIVAAYPDSKNPFADYYADHGPIRKYSKKENGPIISDVKFYDGALGSHRKNLKQAGKNVSVYLSIKTMRADFYLDNGVYKFISVPYDMVAKRGDQYYIDMSKYSEAKQSESKKISDQAEFLFSLHSGEMFSCEKDGELVEWIYNCVNDDAANRIETKFIDKPSPGKTQVKRRITIGKKINNLTKYHVDVLGNRFKVTGEVFSPLIKV